MKKIILTMFIAFGLCNSIKAQVQQVEWEILSLGAIFPTYEYATVGAILATEVRFNFLDGRISPGMQLSLSGFDTKKRDPYTNSIYRYLKHFTSLQGSCDYNFRPRNKVSFFTGLGLRFVGFSSDDWEDDFWISLPVRVGCEFYKRVRVSVEYVPMKYGLGHFSTRLGYVIGGRNK